MENNLDFRRLSRVAWDCYRPMAEIVDYFDKNNFKAENNPMFRIPLDLYEKALVDFKGERNRKFQSDKKNEGLSIISSPENYIVDDLEESDEEKIMRALENGNGDVFGF